MTYERPTSEQANAWINAGPNPDELRLSMSVDVACDLLDEALGSVSLMPQSIYTYTALQVAQSVYKRRATISGATSLLDGESVAYDPKDELNRVWHLIRRYVSPFPTPRDETE